MYGSIYFIFNKMNGKYYIGQTTLDISKRWKRHICMSKYARAGKVSDNYFYRALRFYGEDNFEIRKIMDCPNKETLNEAEIYFISFFESTKRDIGYNSTIGGLGGGKRSLEVRENMSKSHKGQAPSPQTVEAARQANLGIKRSLECCIKMSISGKGKRVGRKLTPEHIENLRKPKSLKARENMKAAQQRLKQIKKELEEG